MTTLARTANFELRAVEVFGDRVAYERLEVISHGLAEKHVVSISLEYIRVENEGTVRYKYTGAYVNHGMRCAKDSLDETREYIGVLTEAVYFIEDNLQTILNW